MKSLNFSLIFLINISVAHAESFQSLDFFSPKPLQQERSVPNSIELSNLPEVIDANDFKDNYLKQTWIIGLACAELETEGQPQVAHRVPIQKYLGKQINAGQSPRFPMLAVSFESDDSYKILSTNAFGENTKNQTIIADAAPVLDCKKVSVNADPENGPNLFQVGCASSEIPVRPIRLKPMILPNGDQVLRTLPRPPHDSANYCPPGLFLYSFYISVPLS